MVQGNRDLYHQNRINDEHQSSPNDKCGSTYGPWVNQMRTLLREKGLTLEITDTALMKEERRRRINIIQIQNKSKNNLLQVYLKQLIYERKKE